jgi:predicted RNA-binding protein (virulence factor B family)
MKTIYLKIRTYIYLCLTMEIGKINKLLVERSTDNGLYLVDRKGNEVLLPNAYVIDEIKLDDEIDVFVYNDSEDRIVATTLTPFIQLEEFAWLKVKEVTRFGAFVDWGLPKDLLVPFARQKEKMQEDKYYLIYLLRDIQTDRLLGTSKVNPFFIYENIDLNISDEVHLLPYEYSDLGIKAVVNGKYSGLIFNSDVHKDVQAGEKIKGYVKNIREDGKIDISLSPMGYKNSIDKNTEIILNALKENDGILLISDKSSPEEISSILGMSKKAFKNTIGKLYKEKLVLLEKDRIKLTK